MKSYPSITTKMTRTNVYVFDKLDGSNIRAEWSDKKGFYKFGSRTKLIDENHPVFGEAVKLIQEKAEQLSSIFKRQNWKRVVAFFEFHGENSFAGSHEDEQHYVTLIDVSVYKKGMLEPRQFVQLFREVGIPNLLFTGRLNENLVTSVKNGTLEGMTYEGVVCKHVDKGIHHMFKVKSRAWLSRLKVMCNGKHFIEG